MQSSAMMAVRAVTLLVCLAAVPLLAIFGKNLPAAVKSLVQSYTNPAKTPPSSTERTDPPVFRPGLLASKSDHATQPVASPADAGRTANDGILPVQPLVPITAAMHRRDSASSSVTAGNSQTPAVPSASTSETSAAGFPPDYFRDAELRIRQLGATYYRLETLEPDAGQYRFFCKVPLGPKADETLAFFATNRDPLAAIEQVVRQIEGWRTAAQP
jgi:hypothetical protein